MLVGVLGTMVWDRIDHPDVPRVERWGGISYSLAAAAAVLPTGWAVRPLVRLGHDLAAPAREFLRSIPDLDRDRGTVEVPEPNNRVHLRYLDREHREEHLTGGVGPWRWSELEPLLADLDALYVNMISGYEIDLDTARRLAGAVSGPLYLDVHSLVLDREPDGRRRPRRLDAADRWIDAFDVVQANERELALLAEDPDSAPRAAIRAGADAVFVTQGPSGARWFAREDAPAPWRTGADRAVKEHQTVASGHVPVAARPRAGDPTGCGDVWGATCFLALLAGEPPSAAAAAANRAAALNVEHRGAEGLHRHLASAA